MANSEAKSKRILIATTVPSSLDNFNRGIFEAYRDAGWDVVGMSGSEPSASVGAIKKRGFKFVPMPFVRQPSLFRDLWCLIRIWWFLVFHRFDLIHASTPKAMLLVTLASFFSFHRKVIVLFHGRAYENAKGLKRKLFIFLDKIVCKLAKKVLAVSESLRNAILQDKIVSPSKIMVIGAGSCNGIDSDYFCQDKISLSQKECFRDENNIATDKFIFLFLGRIRQDKGVNELVRAFMKVKSCKENIQLLLVGNQEPTGLIFEDVKKNIADDNDIKLIVFLPDPRVAYAVADAVVLPSWREGFPLVMLEAGAMRLPVISADSIGLIDSVINEKTGLIVPVRSEDKLADAMLRLANSPSDCMRFAENGYRRVIRDFKPEIIQEGLVKISEEILDS